MKKTILIVIINLCFIITNAQEISYGLVLGSNIKDIEVKGDLNAGSSYGLINFGGFFDYQLNQSLGVKSNLLYSKTIDEYNSPGSFSTIEFKIATVQFHPLIKFDTNKEYNKGFYLIGGPRFSFILNVKDEDGDKVEDFYKGTNFGAMFGFGVVFLKHFGFELIGDFGLSNMLDIEDNKTTTAGAFANLTLNLESLINN